MKMVVRGSHGAPKRRLHEEAGGRMQSSESKHFLSPRMRDGLFPKQEAPASSRCG